MRSSVIFEIIAIVSFSLSGLMFILAGVVFFKFNIPAVIGYLTGNTAKKTIKQMQQVVDRDISGDLIGKTDKLKTDSLRNAMNHKRKKGHSEKLSQETTLLETTDGTTVLAHENLTTVLSHDDTTTVIYNTEELTGKRDSQANTYDTTVDLTAAQDVIAQESVSVVIEADIKFIHTNEVIN